MEIALSDVQVYFYLSFSDLIRVAGNFRICLHLHILLDESVGDKNSSRSSHLRQVASSDMKYSQLQNVALLQGVEGVNVNTSDTTSKASMKVLALNGQS